MHLLTDLPLAVRTLMLAGHQAPSADNSQPWQFGWNGECLSVRYDVQRVSGTTFAPEQHATLLAMGAVQENIAQMAYSLSMELESIRQERNPHDYVKIRMKSLPQNLVETLNHPVFHRHTNRSAYRPRSLPPEIYDALMAMNEGHCKVLVLTPQEIIRRTVQWVRTASEVRFQSRDLHAFLGQSLRFTPDEVNQGDGLDVKTLSLPPGGLLFLRFIKDWNRLAFFNRFGLYKLLGREEARPISKAKTLLGIIGPDTRNDVLDAGMLMERVWLYLNAQGIAVHPYYVVTDQLQRLQAGKVPAHSRVFIQRLKDELETSLKSTTLTLHMLFRLGYPKKTPVRSQRLPLERIVELST